MIIADENVEQHWIDLLRSTGYEVLSIYESHSQISDKRVIEIVQEKKGILITEDKDFGELVFSHGIKGLTILFLRYDQPQYELIQEQVLSCISKYQDSTDYYFITITQKGSRIRKLI